MDTPFSLVDTPAEVITIESEDAPGLQAKVNAMFAALAAVQEPYAIYSVRCAGAGAGGTWLALITAKEGEGNNPPNGTIGSATAAFVCLEQNGNPKDLDATTIAKIAKTTGAALQAAALQFVADNYPDGSEVEVDESIVAGNNAGKRYLVGLVLDVIVPCCC